MSEQSVSSDESWEEMERKMKAERDALLERYKVLTQEFVNKNPLKKDELKREVMGRLSEGVSMTMSPELARQFAKVVQQFEGVFPILQRIYKKAGNDKKVNRAMGKELDRMGGLSMMQGGFYTIANYSPLSIDGRNKGDMEQSQWFYRKLQDDWDGMGPWMA